MNNAPLSSLLKKLKLKNIQSNWENMATKAESLHWTYVQFLTAFIVDPIVKTEIAI